MFDFEDALNDFKTSLDLFPASPARLGTFDAGAILRGMVLSPHAV
jgi:hypothetical protein